MIAFAVAEGGSCQIQVSEVLPGLSMDWVETALNRSQTEDDTALIGWLTETLA